ncbi:hypothetical protein D1007_18108 [Hordeum vulgare]|uniref:Uncharacterized protein n=1 Tax=Hordeum vulgare subsp. vulgare TaxID=112509 RepID=A0A8I6XM74_HORVV|nr:uncharacterized protein LOC123447733 [Hordeum vulgare subsp. vulgare]KAE8805762.1 hypothetical protein D1007_18108 [Hordeum vulgare]
MEIPRSLGVHGNEGEEEEEEYDSVFYEDIEAPKFVDLTAPDDSCPADDPSWFCIRVGCDQSHEHVDPEALHRSFVMRVMAARSPNVRLHKAISRRNQSSMLPKCPHSAPAKPPRTRMTRLSLATEAARARLQGHRIRGLRDSPVRIKAARVDASSARKKALTTPRSKTARPRQEPFLSVKHQKAPVATAAAEIKGTVVKALFMTTPRKEAGRQTPAKSQPRPVAEVCSKMKKLNLACREVPSRYLSQLPTPKVANKCEEETAAVKIAKRVQEPRNGKKMILGCLVKCANAEADQENRSGREHINKDENSCKRTARRNWGEEPKEVLQESRVEVVEPLQPDIHGDDKENAPCCDQLAEQALIREEEEEDENSKRSENNENAPRKVLKRQNKVNAEQGGKLKKNTILRPFRLRTDERQVLKDANPERKPTASEKNTMPKDENRRVMQTGRCPDGKERDKLTCGDKQRKQITHAATSRLGESKTVLSSIRPNNARPALTKGKTVEKSQRAASSTRTAKITSGSTAPSRIGEKRKAPVKTSRLQTAAA